MKHNNLRIILLAGALVAVLTAMSACVGSGTPVDTTPETSAESGATEAPTTPETDAPAEIAVALTVRDQKGSAIAGAVLSLTDEAGEQKAALTTDAEGKATVTLTVGTYTVSFAELPEYHLGGTTELSVTEGMAPVELEVLNNTPDGSEEHPFFINENTATATLVADTPVFFTMFAGDRRSLVIEDPDVTVTFAGTTYTPDGSGTVTVPLTVDNMQSHIAFSVKSTKAGDVSLTIVSEPGSTDNPIAAEAGKDIAVEVPKDTIMYYTYTAKHTGALILTTADTINNISMTNRNNSATTNFTNGSTEPVTIAINAGDVISIAVSTTGGDTALPAQTVTFKIVEEIQ